MGTKGIATLLLLALTAWATFLPGQGCTVSLGPDTSLCAASLTLQPQFSFAVHPDSLVITYDATQGQSGLVDSPKVYMHSAAEMVPFGGWQYPKGNWGQDDGVGEMRPLGQNRWTITIHPQTYYGYPAGAQPNGLFFVFRNAHGTATGKDGNGNDIWASMSVSPPSSAFGGIAFAIQTDALDSVHWSTGASTPTISVGSPGSYVVQAWDTAGCMASDTIQVNIGTLPLIDLGQPAICNGSPATLDAGPGFSQYLWSTGATTSSISVSNPGTYFVTVTTALGCQGMDVVTVPAQADPVAAFTYAVQFPAVVTFSNTSIDGTSFSWDFTGDDIDDSQSSSATVAWVYPAPGSYPVRLIARNSCGTDTLRQTINVQVGQADPHATTFRIGPNPSAGPVQVQVDGAQGGMLDWQLHELSGRRIRSGGPLPTPPSHSLTLDLHALPDGLYLLRIQRGGQSTTQRLLIQH